MKYCLIFIVFINQLVLSQSVEVYFNNQGVLFKEAGDSILFYQTSEKELNGNYKRLNYIHPLYTLDGQILTEDFPTDHFHHRGIFWAWHQLYVGDKRVGDSWDIKNFTWQVLSVNELQSKGEEKSIITHVIWKSPLFLDIDGNEKPLVSEHTTITVYPLENNYRKIDIEISLIAKHKNMRIGGSENEKGYGGFSTRIKLVEDINFTSSTGNVIPKLLPVKAGGWMDISGSLGFEGSMAGLTIFNHPKNPGYLNPWILRSRNSMQNVVYPYPGSKAVNLSDIEPTVLHYRLLIHNCDKSIDIPALYNQYGELY